MKNESFVVLVIINNGFDRLVVLIYMNPSVRCENTLWEIKVFVFRVKYGRNAATWRNSRNRNTRSGVCGLLGLNAGKITRSRHSSKPTHIAYYNKTFYDYNKGVSPQKRIKYQQGYNLFCKTAAATATATLITKLISWFNSSNNSHSSKSSTHHKNFSCTKQQ